MKHLLLYTFSIMLTMASSTAQNNFFETIPSAPEVVTSETVLLRMIDGLGYRFHWASKDLTDHDLSYRPSDDGKSTLHTIEHIYELTTMLTNALHGIPNIRPHEEISLGYYDLREKTLSNLELLHHGLSNMSEGEIESLEIKFKRGEKVSVFPFWNFINGPLSDALYHTGQIVAFRRASGNPISSGVNVFLGRNR